MLVVASQASAVSDWVGREIAFAREQGKTIIPIRVEPVDGHERFADDLGVDASSRQGFAAAIDGLMRSVPLV